MPVDSEPAQEMCRDVGADCSCAFFEILVDNQCLGSAVRTAHLWSWD